jgi:heme O synthase-like polyprenyltransferase
MWQVPHCLVHLAAFGQEYEDIGRPCLTSVFTGRQLDRLTFQWLLATAVSLQMIIVQGLIGSPFVKAALLAASLWLAVEGFRLLKAGRSDYPALFRGVNVFMLAVLLLIYLDAVPRHLP